MLVVLSFMNRLIVPLHLESSSGFPIWWSPGVAAVLLSMAAVTAMAMQLTMQLGRAGVWCCLMVTVSSPAVSWGTVLCYPKPGVAADELSQCTFLVHVVLCFSCCSAAGLGSEPSSQDSSSRAALPRDVLATEPAPGLLQHPAGRRVRGQMWVFRVPSPGPGHRASAVCVLQQCPAVGSAILAHASTGHHLTVLSL